EVATFTATTRAPATGAPPASFTYPRILPVLVCDHAAGAAMTRSTRPRNSQRPSCSNDLRLMIASPVRVFASLITRTQGFVKSGDGQLDCGRRRSIFLLTETEPDAPA